MLIFYLNSIRLDHDNNDFDLIINCKLIDLDHTRYKLIELIFLTP